MTEEVTLAPCPKCGCDKADTEIHRKYWFVECMRCEYFSDANYTEAEAVAAWNARANQPPAQDGLVEALQELLKIGVPRMWKCERGDYCVSIMQKEYFGATLSEAADAALASLGDKP